MSFFMKLMIAGWATTFAMIGVCALHESGKLLSIRRRLASWLERSAARKDTAGVALAIKGD